MVRGAIFMLLAALLASGAHSAVVMESTGCECLGVGLDTEGFPDTYGERCAAHDILEGGTMWPTTDLGEWNCQSWCYVDPETCASALPSGKSSSLFYSYEACADDPKLVGADGYCPWEDQAQPGTNVDWSAVTTFNPCTCAGVSHADTDTFGMGYGSQCQPYELNSCAIFWPSENMGSWCCEKWCYVHEACPLGYQGWDDKTKYYSYEVCEQDWNLLASCPWTAENPKGQPLPFAPGYEGCEVVMSYPDFKLTHGSTETMKLCTGGSYGGGSYSHHGRKLMMA